jgi:hypothetical protein
MSTREDELATMLKSLEDDGFNLLNELAAYLQHDKSVTAAKQGAVQKRGDGDTDTDAADATDTADTADTVAAFKAGLAPSGSSRPEAVRKATAARSADDSEPETESEAFKQSLVSRPARTRVAEQQAAYDEIEETEALKQAFLTTKSQREAARRKQRRMDASDA